MKRRSLLGGLAAGAAFAATDRQRRRLLAAPAPKGRDAAAGAPPAPVAVVGARVHTGDGRRLDGATVLLRDGAVASVGPAAQAAIPAGARRIDAAGAWVTPGLFDAEAQTGLVDVQLEPSTVDIGLDEKYDAVRAAYRVVDGLNPLAVTIPITRLEGVTLSALAPKQGLVSGQGALVRLDGRRVEEMLLAPGPSAVYASVAAAGRAAAFGARGGALLRLRELFDDVRQYARRRQDFERNQMRKVAASRLDLEALVPVIEGRLPLVVEAHRASDIEAALRLARDERLKIVLSGCEEGWLLAREIAAARVPVIVSALANLPRSFEALAATLENAARLHRGGVKVAISPRERGEHMSRTLRIEAGNAVAHGLPWEAALAAVTSVPAEIFGVAESHGTIAPRKSGDLVVWSGDPFEPLTRPRHVFIAGREIPRRSRQTELRDRYRSLSGARPAP